jgi:DNA end-binding protein Ku
MKQAVWTGAISFGLVTIPVRLYPATEPKDVRFHLYDRESGKRVRYERIARADEPAAFMPQADEDDDVASSAALAEPERAPGGPVAVTPLPVDRRLDAGDVVRGFTLPTGDLVTVTEDELGAVAPSRSRTIDIEEFVELAEIDPVHFQKSYYVAPTRAAGSEKPYTLLLRAMRSSGAAAIGRFVLRTRPHLVAIRATEHALVLHTLFFADEVRQSREVVGQLPGAGVSDRELRQAEQLIEALATDWVPEKHADQYREELLDLLRSRSPEPLAEPSAGPTSAGVDDLMSILKASVEAAKRADASGKRYPSVTRRRG